MDADEKVSTMAALLKAVNHRFQIMASGHDVDAQGHPVWDAVAIDVWHDGRREFVRLTSVEETRQFLSGRR